MYSTLHIIRAPYTGAFFLVMLVATTTIIGMESELKQRFLVNNPNDTKILIEQSTTEDCSICYEEKEVTPIPCKMGEKHPVKICSVCLDGCNGLCPYCRNKLTIEKKRNALTENIYQCYNDSLSYCDRLCLGVSCGCLPIYLYMLFTAFP